MDIKADKIDIQFTIDQDLVCVSRLSRMPNNCLNFIVGQYYRFPTLKKVKI